MRKITILIFVFSFILSSTIIAQKKIDFVKSFVVKNDFNYEISETKVINDSLYVLFVNPNKDGKCGYLDNKIEVYSLHNTNLCYTSIPQQYDRDKKEYYNSKATTFTVSKKGFLLSSGGNQLLTNSQGIQKSFCIWHNKIGNYKTVRSYLSYPILQIYDEKLLVSVIAYNQENKQSYAMYALYDIPENQEKIDSLYKNFPNYLIGKDSLSIIKSDLYDVFNKNYVAVSQKNKLIFVSNDGTGTINVYENRHFRNTWSSKEVKLKEFKLLRNDTVIVGDEAKKKYQYLKANNKRLYELQYNAYRDMIFDDKSDLLYRVYYLPAKCESTEYEKLFEADSKRMANLQVFDKTGKKILDRRVKSNIVLAGVSDNFIYFRQNIPDKLGEFVFYVYKFKK